MRINKRGHLPTILVFVVALVLCTSALLAFVSFGNNFGHLSKELADTTTEADFSEKYIISSAAAIAEESAKVGSGQTKQEFMRIANERDLRLEAEGNFFGKIRAGEFEFDKQGNEYVLKIDGLFVQSQRGENKIKRNFNVLMRFDMEGKRIS